MKLTLANCFWLVVPALLWNVLFTARLTTDGLGGDTGVPSFILTAEMALRIVVFAGPILLPICFNGRLGRVGSALLFFGYGIYFASWLPHLTASNLSFARSTAGAFAPYATPLVFLLGIALIGRSWLYGMA
ncbi:MAG: hypothetical protein GY798_21325, partial [Hyphomicrobiales bacterium]|nr:hypothetical protein [Hyphomicrobiales bacterium]